MKKLVSWQGKSRLNGYIYLYVGLYENYPGSSARLKTQEIPDKKGVCMISNLIESKGKQPRMTKEIFKHPYMELPSFSLVLDEMSCKVKERLEGYSEFMVAV